MQSGLGLTSGNQEKTAYLKLIEIIGEPAHASDFKRFLSQLIKFIRHAQLGITASPSKNVNARIILLKGQWNNFAKTPLLAELDETSQALLNYDFNNNLTTLLNLFPKGSEELEDLIDDMVRVPNQEEKPDAKLFVPTAIRSGNINHFAEKTVSPLHDEMMIAINLFEANRVEESLEALQKLIAKVNAIPELSSHYQQVLLDAKSHIANVYEEIAHRAFQEGKFEKSHVCYRLSIIELESLIAKTDDNTKFKAQLLRLSSNYCLSLNNHLLILCADEEHEAILSILQKIAFDSEISQESKPTDVSISRVATQAIYNIGKQQLQANQVAASVKYFTAALSQIKYVRSNYPAVKTDDELLFNCLKYLLKMQLNLSNFYLQNQQHAAAMTELLSVLKELKDFSPDTLPDFMQTIWKEAFNSYEKHLLNYFSLDKTNPSYIVTATQYIVPFIDGNVRLHFIANKNLNFIGLKNSYDFLVNGQIDTAVHSLKLSTAPFNHVNIKTAHEMMFLAEHKLNDLLILISSLREFYISAPSDTTERDREWLTLTDRFTATVLLEQSAIFDIKNKATYHPAISMLNNSYSMFDDIIEEHKIPSDADNLHKIKQRFASIKNALINKVNDAVNIIHCSFSNRYQFFAAKYGRMTVALLVNITNRLKDVEHDDFGIAYDELNAFRAKYPDIHCNRILEDISQAAHDILSLGYVRFKGDEVIISFEMECDETASTISHASKRSASSKSSFSP